MGGSEWRRQCHVALMRVGGVAFFGVKGLGGCHVRCGRGSGEPKSCGTGVPRAS